MTRGLKTLPCQDRPWSQNAALWLFPEASSGATTVRKHRLRALTATRHRPSVTELHLMCLCDGEEKPLSLTDEKQPLYFDAKS